jgi:hypothetical protein
VPVHVDVDRTRLARAHGYSFGGRHPSIADREFTLHEPDTTAAVIRPAACRRAPSAVPARVSVVSADRRRAAYGAVFVPRPRAAT